MSDNPIPFSAPMVRALLDGHKTQTRRVLAPQPVWDGSLWHVMKAGFDGGGHGIYETEAEMLRDARIWWRWRVGDRLWVKEAWRACSQMDGMKPSAMSQHEPRRMEADGAMIEPACMMLKPGRYRHARFMPRWASRLTLTVTDVRVQRLQEISRGEAMEEGCPFPNMAAGPNPRDWFRDLWNNLHGPDAWGANPWVVALTFTVHRGNIDRIELPR